jgi:hypothetical protein
VEKMALDRVGDVWLLAGRRPPGESAIEKNPHDARDSSRPRSRTIRKGYDEKNWAGAVRFVRKTFSLPLAVLRMWNVQDSWSEYV